MKPPKFTDVEFYPGYSYGSGSYGNPERSAAGRYVALGEDGKVYCFALDGREMWVVVGGVNMTRSSRKENHEKSP